MNDLTTLASLVTDAENAITAAEQRIVSTLRELASKGCTVIVHFEREQEDMHILVYAPDGDTMEIDDALLVTNLPGGYVEELEEFAAC